MTASGHHVAEGALHHSGLDGKVDDSLFLAVVDSGKFSLVGLLVHHLELVDDLGGDVLGGKLGVIEEEGLAVDGYLLDCLSVVGNGTIFRHFDSGELLQQVLEHVVLRGLEGGGVVLDGVFLDDDGVAGGRHGSRVELLGIDFHTDFTEVLHIGHLYLLLVGKVAEQLGFKGIGTGTHAADFDFSVGFAEHVFGWFLGSVEGERDGGKTHGLTVGFINQDR